MMTEEEYQEFLDDLRKLLVGTVVERVEAADFQKEQLFTLVVRAQDGEQRTVALGGNELGVWIRGPHGYPLE